MQPFLILVLAGYAGFVIVLAVYWLRQYLTETAAPAPRASEVGEKRDSDELGKAA